MSESRGTKNIRRGKDVLLAVIALLSSCFVIQSCYEYGSVGAQQREVIDSATKIGTRSPNRENDKAAGGCSCPYTQNQHLNRSIPVFRTEEGLMTNRPGKFNHMRSFDEDRRVFKGFLGGFVDLRGAYVFSEHQISFDCDFIYVPNGCKAQDVSDGNIFSLLASSMNYIQKASLSESRIKKLETAIIIAQYWGDSYFHALIEDLPRLSLALDVLESDSEAVILSYPGSLMHPTSRPQLINKLLGLGNNRKWVPFDHDRVYFVEKLIIPTATRCGYGQPKALSLIRDKIFANVPSVLNETLERFWLQYPETRAGEKTIILIQKRATRSLLNHDDVLAALRIEFANCCTVIEFLGTEPLEEYIVMHHQANVIIGPHGAGLSNVLFASPTAALIEIHPKIGNVDGTQVNECHQMTARSLGLESIMLVQESGEYFGSDFTADVRSVIDALHELL